VLERSTAHDFRLRYFNRDGSLGELCGNASLCATRLAVELGAAKPGGMSFETDAGVVEARMRDGLPEIDLQAPTGLEEEVQISRQAGERRLGFVNSGVPHLVVRTDDLATIDLAGRGPELRFHESLSAGANVNWVARDAAGAWAMRTYERGVEAETLACGTGAVACAVLLRSWGEAEPSGVALRTRSGKELRVSLREDGGRLVPSLAGEGRIVYEGTVREL
jgi:diaminopimelate epimerase